MRYTRSRTALLVCALSALPITLSACATTELAPTAQNVRVISEEQTRGCKFIDTVSTNNMNTLSKNPELDARNRAMNLISQRGGNAIYIKATANQISPSGIGSIFHLTGDAYACP